MMLGEFVNTIVIFILRGENRKLNDEKFLLRAVKKIATRVKIVTITRVAIFYANATNLTRVIIFYSLRAVI